MDPFALIDSLNAGRAAMAEEKHEAGLGVDEIQIARDAQKRERWGRLRARPRSRGRPITGRIVRGHMEDPAAPSK